MPRKPKGIDPPQIEKDWPELSHVRDKRKRSFLLSYASRGGVMIACKDAGICSATHYRWLLADQAYRDAYAVAQELATDLLEAEARRRAFIGSDILLIFLLKGLRPDRYQDRYRMDGTQVPAQRLSDAEIDRRVAQLLGAKEDAARATSAEQGQEGIAGPA